MESTSRERLEQNIQSPDYFDWVLFDNALMRFLNETTGMYRNVTLMQAGICGREQQLPQSDCV